MEGFDAWISKAEVVERTGLTERTIERKVKLGELRREYRTIPGRKPLPIFHPEDVENLTVKTLQPIPLRRSGVPTPRQLVPRQTPPMSVSVPLTEKFYLTLKEAALLSGLPLSYLKRQAQQGGIPAVKLVGWRIHSDDLKRHRVSA